MHTPSVYRLGLVGHAGRMGQQVLACLAARAPKAAQAELAALYVHRTPPPEALAHLGQKDALAFVQSADVVLDFSAPAACAVMAPLCAKLHKAYLVASTGLGAEDEVALARASQSTAVLVAANLSLGVNVLMELVALAAQRLAQTDIEIFEMHHRHKRDAPSGTALALGAAAAQGREKAGEVLRPVLARADASALRQAGDIGYGALRGGDVAGEHTVFFLDDGERVELGHRATRPDIFARGALTACAWLASAQPGRYTMQDVIRGN